MARAAPVLTVLAVLLLVWYAAAVAMNAAWERDQAARAGRTIGWAEIAPATMTQDRPVLPAPHQVVAALWDGLAGQGVTSKRSLVWHGWVTLRATAAGFAFGTVLGMILAAGIVQFRVMEMSVMPWAIASQTVPIVAIAPMIVVVLGSIGITGLVPKALLAGYLTFFPVVVGMVKGLRAPDAMQLDLMRTWNAGPLTTMRALRLPASLPYLFTSLKVGVAAAVVGTVVTEVSQPTAGLGARLLTGSYYGQTLQIWAALFVAAGLAAGLVGLVGLVERVVLRRTGQAA